jgi:hypothetical protein
MRLTLSNELQNFAHAGLASTERQWLRACEAFEDLRQASVTGAILERM